MREVRIRFTTATGLVWGRCGVDVEGKLGSKWVVEVGSMWRVLEFSGRDGLGTGLGMLLTWCIWTAGVIR